MKKRLWIVYGCMITLFCGLLFRIYTLSDHYLRTAADRQSSVTVTVANVRGTIYDRNGAALVNSEKEYRACVNAVPSALTVLSETMDAAAFSSLSKSLQSGKPVVVRLENLAAANGISLFEVPLRYGKRVLAPHLIGYMDGNKTEGLTGVEAAFDSLLNTHSGKATVTYSVDANGKVLSGITPKLANSINNATGGIRLTIDADIQELAENIAAKYIKKGAVVIMNPANGDILSLVSLPTYHPDKVADVLQDPSSPLLNRALCSYNCGSVYKIVSAATALETGGVAAQQYTCNGNMTIGKNVFHCHHRLGHGNLTMEDAFAKSCNCYFIQLMHDVGGSPLVSLSERLQFGSSISLCDGIQTAVSQLPDAAILEAPAALANLSFGQGELTASPLHIATLVSTVLNDGILCSPRIVYGYTDSEGAFTEAEKTVSGRVFSSQTAAVLRQMMEKVTTDEGTGAAGKPQYGIAGAKTGTAETGWAPAEGEKHAVVHSWYAGYYTPRQGTDYVIVAFAENAENTGAKTAPVFKEIADALYKLKDEE